jgi:hypothetical protein
MADERIRRSKSQHIHQQVILRGNVEFLDVLRKLISGRTKFWCVKPMVC